MLEEILVHTLELAERGGVLGGWILEIVVRQPDMLSRAGKGAKEGKTPGVGRIRRSVPCNDVVGDAKSALVVGLVQAHVHPSAVLLVQRLVGIQGALLQEGVCDLVVNVLLQLKSTCCCNSRRRGRPRKRPRGSVKTARERGARPSGFPPGVFQL